MFFLGHIYRNIECYILAFFLTIFCTKIVVDFFGSWPPNHGNKNGVSRCFNQERCDKNTRFNNTWLRANWGSVVQKQEQLGCRHWHRTKKPFRDGSAQVFWAYPTWWSSDTSILQEPFVDHMSYGQYSWLVTIIRILIMDGMTINQIVSIDHGSHGKCSWLHRKKSHGRTASAFLRPKEAKKDVKGLQDGDEQAGWMRSLDSHIEFLSVALGEKPGLVNELT